MKSFGLDGRTLHTNNKSKLELQTYGLRHTRNFLYHVLATVFILKLWHVKFAEGIVAQHHSTQSKNNRILMKLLIK